MEHSKADRRAVVEAVDAAEEYVQKLEDLLKTLTEAEHQVKNSAKQARDDVNFALDTLAAAFTNALKQRRSALLEEVDRLCSEGLAPLTECRDLITTQMQVAHSYANEGRHSLDDNNKFPVTESWDDYTHSFAERGAAFLGRLPAVPNLEDVPGVQFECCLHAVEADLMHTIERVGSVSRLGPVQICAVEEKPGALLVHWQQVETEKPAEIGSFRLQRAYGDVRGRRELEANFHDEYVGPECQYLIRNLRPKEPVTLRVCCREDSELAPWSAWSVLHVAATSLPPFCWEETNQNYIVTNEKQLATKSTAEPSVLFSCGPQFGPGHAVEFTVLECGAGCSDEGLALADHHFIDENLLQPGVIFVNAQGSVFVDGKGKTTKLPPLEKGSKLCFTCEHVRNSKVRIHIDSGNKTVAYDWNVTSPLHKLFFAICFGQVGWKVLVE
ncbi:cytokine receptor-like factor 3 isoform X2 [Schistocerca gregaria]|uniref:cytokine receptor-like factor 3 isoform X2 n=1 Tax=Schistocerca gregaria TaxID=7010 RepID=UPI00211DCE5F|nr:cytokine receptor-like factor 3 isoform X2 [Schistocerca gregaria]